MAVALPMSHASAATCAAAWNSTTAYSGGAQVSYNGRNYTARWWTQGDRPDQNAGTGGDNEWTDSGACDGGSTPAPPPAPAPSCNYPNWAAGTWYAVGSIVRYTDGNYYIAVNANPGYDPVISHWYWDPYTCSGGPTTPPNPGPGPGGFVVTEAQFNQMFPSRNSFYTYSGLTTAMNSFPAFAKTGSDTVRKQEAAAALANFSHETGGLVHITEINKSNDLCDESKSYGCPAGTYGYYGRGPIQLSWNFNYYTAGNALGLPLLNNPYLVEQDAAVAWKTGLWYWMTQNGPGTMTAHDAMVNQRGFGETIRSINGSLECNGGNPGQVQSRINNYQRFTQILGVAPGGNLSC
jgi:predicted chitinase/chitodextrinase